MDKMTKNVLRLIAAGSLISGIFTIKGTFDDMKTEKERQEQQEQAQIDSLKAGYDQLEIGMTYGKCVSILGVEGEKVTESESEYFGKNELYLWKPYEDSFMVGIEAHFTNGELTNKAWVEY